MVYEIKLSSPKDVKALNDAALDYEGELSVSCDSLIVNAKSILALFALIGRKNVKLVADDNANFNKFKKLISSIA